MTPAPWTVVGGIADAYRLHGICSSDSWFRDNGTALVIQGPEIGAHPFGWDTRTLDVGVISAGFLHPNASGYAAIGERIAAALEPQVRQRFTIAAAPRLVVDSVSAPTAGTARMRGSRPLAARARRPTGTIVLSWNNPAPEATTKFVLTVDGRTTDLPATATSHVVHADGRIAAQIRACGPVGCGPESQTLRPTNVIPGAPTDLRQAAGPGAPRWSGVLSLTWAAADGNHEHFELSYRKDGAPATLESARPTAGTIRSAARTAGRVPSGETVVRTPSTSHQIGSPQAPLPAAGAYVVKVRACGSAGCSDWTPELTAAVGGAAPAPRPDRPR
jgi:hypothetical protein